MKTLRASVYLNSKLKFAANLYVYGDSQIHIACIEAKTEESLMKKFTKYCKDNGYKEGAYIW